MKRTTAIMILFLVFLFLGIGSLQADVVEEAVERNKKGAELLGQGMMEEALAEFQMAVELNPKDPVARLNLAFTYDKQGQVEEAIGAYKQAIELDEKNLFAYNNLGVLYNKTGRYDEAILQLENAQSINPSDANTLKNLENARKNKAIMQERENQIAEARMAVDAYPDNARALFKLGRLYAFYDKKEEAFEWIAKAMERGYDDPNNLKMDPALDKIRDDPRFINLMQSR